MTAPFETFARSLRSPPPLRAAITAAYRRPEPACVPPLLDLATLSPAATAKARALARRLVEALRAKVPSGGVEGLIHEYALSSQEGVALMCLAEALLRIPDDETRDALIRDKIGGGDWRAHLGRSPSLFVNAATWGLMLTGRLTATSSETGLSAALTRLIAKGGEPLIRGGVNIAMRLMGEQFVAGQTIGEALANGRRFEAEGFRYSYDMLGEAAITAAQAEHYRLAYERAIHAIGRASAGRGIYEGPGISLKLSALHPRYSRSQVERVHAELYPRLRDLAVLARRYDIGVNIDAEEADRLEISLDLLERLCFEPALEGWNGIGFVVQAYKKRAAFVIDHLIDLGRRSRHRLMIRLVKGAYWDSEIKRAQVDGLEDFPVFTRKIHTDVSYLACARKLLAAPDAAFPQFATHNALTLASIHAMAGENFYAGQYEFQCLHGMGEPLYEEVVGREKLNRPCRIYAPVGTHETLLAYLVRRLLENGANTSFVNQVADPEVAIDSLLADPVERARRLSPIGAPHPLIKLPRDLFGPTRANSRGLDLVNESVLAALARELVAGAPTPLSTTPVLVDGPCDGIEREVCNPADKNDLVGTVIEATPDLVDEACAKAEPWSAAPAGRAATLRRAADLMEARTEKLLGPIVREAGKTLGNAVGEVREAVDFLRYYAVCIEGFDNEAHRPLGVVACISPWNFPLSIFTGQVAGALAAGNGVIAKPAEETPLIAALAVELLHEAGVPRAVLQFLPGDGEIGKRLVANAAVAGVVFTGSTEAAQSINRSLARRLGADGRPVPLIAETGGQNALVADSSALPEQLVIDALTSAFDSAGQRCSALRVLCLQDDIADKVVPMLEGAMAELGIGNPDRLSVDVGPVISTEAQKRLLDHVERMRAAGHRVHQVALPDEAARGTFVPPTLIEIGSIVDLPGEVFGPVLHVLRYPREAVEEVIRAVNATGFGLTFGVHSRIDETIERATAASAAGNQYVNRNMIGAVVGVQPFGGHGLSGTGPKAGGPLYVGRLLASGPAAEVATGELVGPVGERNGYALRSKGAILCVASDPAELTAQRELVRATGNRVASGEADDIAAVLFSGSESDLIDLAHRLADRPGRIVPVHVAPYSRALLFDEVSLSVNTAAAGGNASLMAIG
ncbi:bifunctional proline dehydrogenase/L-glutamate gamma-semialdehyde dehydrogenase PutA [Reyranella sp.]|uniref:bifunctional proline dehydrogenase/L-glutamate gamma-semialdehyde dehydrogenase PutA n=1 Tax=Reyranella sp. TaxID=1929291 RepID=UPI0040370B2D